MPEPSASTAALARRVHEAAHLTGRFVLRSGQTSETYFDKYAFEADPVLLADIAAGMTLLVPDEIDVLAGLELGGVPIATALSAATGLPARFVRKAAKTYGTCRQAEGGGVAGLRIAIVEDVVSTGGAILDAARALRAAGAQVVTVLCVIDRESGGRENLAADGLPLRPLFTTSELVGAAT